MATEEDRQLTISQAASLWQVNQRTVRAWIKQGRITCFGPAKSKRPRRASLAHVREEKVLWRSDLVDKLKIAMAALGRAERKGIVVPSDGGLFSLNDVDRIERDRERTDSRRERTGRETERTTVDSGNALSPLGTADDRFELYRMYASGARAPNQFPDWFWEVPSCPKFIPPRGVFLHWMHESYPASNGEPAGRWMARSCGWMPCLPDETKAGDSGWEYVEEDLYAGCVMGGPHVSLPEGVALDNLLYEAARQEWESEYHRRSLRAKVADQDD